MGGKEWGKKEEEEEGKKIPRKHRETGRLDAKKRQGDSSPLLRNHRCNLPSAHRPLGIREDVRKEGRGERRERKGGLGGTQIYVSRERRPETPSAFLELN